MRGATPLFSIALILFIGAATRDAVDRWVDTTDLPPLVSQVSTEVRDRNGHLLRAYMVENGRWRMSVTQDRVDPLYLDMLLAYEDKRFYRHSGIDPLALGRALWQSVKQGRIVSGGSTLTMQVARLLENGTTGRWSGKLRQMRVALVLERHLSKEQILSLYLLNAPFGGNIEGVRAASLAWFGKEPHRLSASEAALLVALPQAPELRRPDRHENRALEGRNRVLASAHKQSLINRESYETARVAPLPTERNSVPAIAPHLSDAIRAERPDIPRHNLTIDRDVQSGLETLAEQFVTNKDSRLSVALMVADHVNGDVIASVGSPHYSETEGRLGYVDMTRALRSPGSTLKPLIFGMAFDRGAAHPETIMTDLPTRFGTYAPQNFDGRFRGALTAREALQLSLNIPTVTLTEALGPANLMASLRKSGASPVVPGGKPGLATALGGVGMTMRDLMQVYAMLAQNGVAKPLRSRTSEEEREGVRVISPSAAWHVSHILAGIAPPPAGGPVGRVAYKTGTSYGHRDAWAIGYDGRYVAAVWIGRPDGTPVPGVFGADLAAPLLFEVLGRVRSEPVPLPAPPPETLIVSNAELPPPLKRFARAHEDEANKDILRVAFPPDGATIDVIDNELTVKLDGGRAPFTVLRDGHVAISNARDHAFAVSVPDQGFTTLSIIDVEGRSGRVSVELR